MPSSSDSVTPLGFLRRCAKGPACPFPARRALRGNGRALALEVAHQVAHHALEQRGLLGAPDATGAHVTAQEQWRQRVRLARLGRREEIEVAPRTDPAKAHTLGLL